MKLAQKRKTQRRSRLGSILAVVLIVMILVGLTGIALLRLAMADGVEAGKTLASVRAFWAAEAGIERVKSVAQKRLKPFPLIQVNGTTFFGSNLLSGTLSGSTFVADVIDDPSWTNNMQVVKRYIIRGRANSAGFSQSVAVKTTIETFASYMFATGSEEMKKDGSDIFFGSGDVVDGPVYINDQINLYGTPTFMQLVRSAASSVYYTNKATDASFTGGLELNVAPLDFTNQNYLTSASNDAANGGLLLSGNYRLNFNTNGTVVYRSTAGGAIRTNKLSQLTNKTIYVAGDLYISGVVSGQVTVASQQSIYISNNIVYASASGSKKTPWTSGFDPEAVTDALGLIAASQVQITATNDVTIHAAVLVVNDGDGFNALHWDDKLANSPPYLNLYGSLAQYRRGVVGRSNGDGFQKNYKYDRRFYHTAPPGYPYSNYSYFEWKQTSN